MRVLNNSEITHIAGGINPWTAVAVGGAVGYAGAVFSSWAIGPVLLFGGAAVGVWTVGMSSLPITVGAAVVGAATGYGASKILTATAGPLGGIAGGYLAYSYAGVLPF